MSLLKTLRFCSHQNFQSPAKSAIYIGGRGVQRFFHLSSCSRECFKVQDEEDFEKRVMKSKTPIILDFFATWCGPCKVLTPRLEKVVLAQGDKVHLAKVDIDENGEIAMDFGVSAVPSVMAIRDGKVMDKFMGVIDEDKIQKDDKKGMKQKKEKEELPIVVVVVLGDLGHSPRMRYHVTSLRKEGFRVVFVGYKGSNLDPSILQDEGVKISYVREFNSFGKGFFGYLLKTLLTCIALLWALPWTLAPKCILVQNPPSIPSLPILWLYCLIAHSRLMIDWHNYGHTLLKLSLSDSHPFVRLCRWCEWTFGAKAAANFCVTEAMRKDLEKHGISALTLRDLPNERFRPVSVKERHEILLELVRSGQCPALKGVDENSTIVTRFCSATGMYVLQEKRPGIIFSSTSWTADEDFSILLTALEEYEDAKCRGLGEYPDLVCIITGKGPLKPHYEKLINSRIWAHVSIYTLWVESLMYPKIVAAVDLGVSLHTSTSGLDLPMKVVDMFACGVPVLAANFFCIEELVRPGETGFLFNDAKELSSLLKNWFQEYPTHLETIQLNQRMSEHLRRWNKLKWHDAWCRSARDAFFFSS
ncbi:unnamed protein product [Darwinula stevensoni]|uniref:Thioredoxin domain-containing protein n=1 Tax=Darwinula stevensoni TaxID=69355 RepID=A0A7R8X4X4_9CRUS|nr:unnamed protein product [Darwinula stevensoni]CAG0884173.1 unnamed protein product [Darwinula stevensoni]